MPDLSVISDSEALENRYLAKTIIYVESEHDEEAYRRFAGPDIADRLEFKTPKTGASGWEAVRDRVRDERPTNDKIYGLFDGEAVMHFSKWDALIACKRHLFQIGAATAQGLIFLSCHELENLLLLYGDVCAVIVKDVRLKELSKHKEAEIRKALHESARRYFVAAAMKYAAMEVRRAGIETVVFPVGKFLERRDAPATALVGQLRSEVQAAGLDWPCLRHEIRAIAKCLKDRFRVENLEEPAVSYHYIRLADGKGLLNRLRQLFGSGHWDGHLVHAVCSNPYAGQFRDELLELTAA